MFQYRRRKREERALSCSPSHSSPIAFSRLLIPFARLAVLRRVSREASKYFLLEENLMKKSSLKKVKKNWVPFECVNRWMFVTYQPQRSWKENLINWQRASKNKYSSEKFEESRRKLKQKRLIVLNEFLRNFEDFYERSWKIKKEL